MTHYTNLHTFTVIQKICTEKSNILELSYAFADFRNIAQSVNYAKLLKMFITLSTILNEILEPIGE
jgi:hypothetical protein